MTNRHIRRIKKVTTTLIIVLILCVVVTINLRQQTKELKLAEEQLGISYNMLSEKLTQIEAELEVLDTVYLLAEKYELEPELILAMMKVESNFNPSAVNQSGTCKGILQIHDIHNVANVFDLKVNTEAACSYLSTLKKGSENIHQMLGKYNRGERGYKAYAERTKNELTLYSEVITQYVEELKGNHL